MRDRSQHGFPYKKAGEKSNCNHCYNGIRGDIKNDGRIEVFKCEYCHSEKFTTPEPLPTPYENELLTILIEEAAEVIQRATKAKRFGLKEVQPGQKLNNVERLSLEVGDFIHMVNMCRNEGMVTSTCTVQGMSRKKEQLKKFMQTSKGG